MQMHPVLRTRGRVQQYRGSHTLHCPMIEYSRTTRPRQARAYSSAKSIQHYREERQNLIVASYCTQDKREMKKYPALSTSGRALKPRRGLVPYSWQAGKSRSVLYSVRAGECSLPVKSKSRTRNVVSTSGEMQMYPVLRTRGRVQRYRGSPSLHRPTREYSSTTRHRSS